MWHGEHRGKEEANPYDVAKQVDLCNVDKDFILINGTQHPINVPCPTLNPKA